MNLSQSTELIRHYLHAEKLQALAVLSGQSPSPMRRVRRRVIADLQKLGLSMAQIKRLIDNKFICRDARNTPPNLTSV